MTLEIINTNGTAPYGIGEIIEAIPVANLNAAEVAYDEWVQEHVIEGGTPPRGIVVDGENQYDVVTGDLID